MRRAVIAAALALVAWSTTAAQAPADSVDLKGKFYKSVFFSAPGALAESDLGSVPEPVKGRLAAYLKRRSTFASKIQGGAASFEDARAEAKKRIVERAIVSLVDAPGVDDAAAEFAQGAKILADWTASPAGPLAEAAYAEEALKKQPSSAMAPYLYVFIANRHRAAFEMMSVAKDKVEMTAAAKKYRTFMQRARSTSDPIFRLLADDMDRQPFLYVKSEHHPRDFDPDS